MEALIEYLNAERGRRKKLAEALGLSPSAISMWTEVPSDRVVDIERETGIPRQKLLPELFRGMVPLEESAE